MEYILTDNFSNMKCAFKVQAFPAEDSDDVADDGEEAASVIQP